MRCLCLVVTILLAACTRPTGSPIRFPDGCAEVDLAPRRCAAVVRRVADEVGLPFADVVGFELLPDETLDGKLLIRSGAFLRLRLWTAKGPGPEGGVHCGVGSANDPACTDRPIPSLNTPHGGYWDVPCGGEAPDTCASPQPSPTPDVLAQARPLVLHSFEVPLDRPGRYEVEVGRATLPNGILSEANASLDVPAEGALIGLEGIAFEIRPVDPARPPFESHYTRPTVEGVEPVRVVLAFDVLEAPPGSVLRLRQIVVR